VVQMQRPILEDRRNGGMPPSLPLRPEDLPVMPIVAPPVPELHREEGAELHTSGPRRPSALADGVRSAYGMVIHERATWRESLVGSAFVLGVLTAASCVVAVATAIRQWQRNRGR
jgi:hypothetical protein